MHMSRPVLGVGGGAPKQKECLNADLQGDVGGGGAKQRWKGFVHPVCTDAHTQRLANGVNYVAETVCDYVSVLSKHEHNVAFANNVEVITNHFLRCQTTHAVPCGTRASSCRDRPTFQRGRIQKGPLHVLRGAWGLDPILEIQCGKTHSKGFKVVAEIANGDRHRARKPSRYLNLETYDSPDEEAQPPVVILVCLVPAPSGVRNPLPPGLDHGEL